MHRHCRARRGVEYEMKLEKFEADNVDLGTVILHLTLSPLRDSLQLGDKLNGLVGQEIDIDVKKHREKRSLNANSYFHVLCGKIADALDSSKDEVHNLMLQRYGQYARNKDGNIIFLLVPDTEDYAKDPEIHLKPTGKSEDRNGMTYYWYAKMKPSHEYNTQEMAKLIDGTISEAKELGIEVLPPDEIKRMENM